MGRSWPAATRRPAPAFIIALALALFGAAVLWQEWAEAGRRFDELSTATELDQLERRQLHLYLEACLGDSVAPGLWLEGQARIDELLARSEAPAAVNQERDRMVRLGAILLDGDLARATSLYRSELAPMERSLAAGDWVRGAQRRLSTSLDRARALTLVLGIAAGLVGLWLARRNPAPSTAADFEPRELQGLAESFTRIARDVRHTTQVASSRAYTERILGSISNLLIVISPESLIKAVNGATCDTLGYREDELLGKPVSFIMEPARDPLLQISYRNVEATFLARDGRRIPALVSVSVVRDEDQSLRGVVVTAQDISDRKEAEGALRESEERFRAIFSAAALGIARLDVDGRIAHANAAMRRLLNLPADLEPGLLEDYFHPEDRAVGRELFEALACGRRDSVQCELRFSAADGQTLWANTIYSLVRDANEQPRFVICMVENVTARKLAEQELDRARIDLERYAGNLEEKEARLRQLLERLVGAQEEERRTVAHDLHDGLLQYIISAELHLKAFQKSLRQDQRTDLSLGIERLHSAVVEGRRLIYNLRPSTLDRFGLVRTLKRHVEELRSELGWTVEFEVELPDPRLPPAVETTVYRLVQEALNNVRKHSGSDWVRVSLQGSRTEVRIEVEDRGAGFDPGSVGEGGVGLHSMRDRAELSGGSFEIRSSPGQGTRLLATVPLPATLSRAPG
ncbi:MAG: PAS domain S-box protein [Armatimonadetes bacterium]|nr:PAS domain S-box protein [Armatimonadota bacterium]